MHYGMQQLLPRYMKSCTVDVDFIHRDIHDRLIV